MSTGARRFVWPAFVAAAIIVFVLNAPSATSATTFVVDTAQNDDPARNACTAAPNDCSLPGAVAAANATPGADTIEFDIPADQCPDGVCPIKITKGPMTITESLLVDGTSQPQHGAPQANACATGETASHPRIQIITDPNEATNPDPDAFRIDHGTGISAIRGLAIGSDEAPAESAAIAVESGSGHHIYCNHFGVASDGTTTLGVSPFYAGVLIESAAGSVTVGTNGDDSDDVAERNVFGTGTYTVRINDSSDNTIAGNYLGVSGDGTTKIGSGQLLITLASADNTVGSDGDGTADEAETNYFGAGIGVNLDATSGAFTGNVVNGNYFGVLPAGGGSTMATGVVVGDMAASATVEITGNVFGPATTGIDITGNDAGAEATVSGNLFGLTPDGTALQGSGIAVELNNLGDHLITSNYIANAKTFGLSILDGAGLASGSVDNCFVDNVGGAQNTTGSTVVIEDNWWGSPDGPSGSGPGTGDSVGAGLDFDPWSATPPAICNVAPVVADMEFDVAESAATGSAVGTVTATDEAAVTFSIDAGNDAGRFAIDPGTGEITVAGALDFETVPIYSLTVRVADPLLSTTVTVTVSVIDVFEVPDVATFGDVPLGHLFFSNIEWLAYTGITKGCNPPDNDMFCPDAPVTRGQMAAFLRRALGDTLIAGDPVTFTDDDGSVFENDIEWLAAVRVTKGCNPPVNDQFCPNDSVTRGQMAAFMVRAFNYRDGAGSDQFTDDDDSVFEENIERLAHAGVTKGCNPPVNDLFCPDAPVTRAQMAAFLFRAMGG